MKVAVLSRRKHKFNINEVLAWTKEQFEDVVLIHHPTGAELHRVCYDNKVTGVFVFYFRDEKDYVLFCLKWL